MERFDLIVVGGGSAGLKAARTAARLGRSVALAEERELGGECFWAGCVPTKAMVRAAQVWHTVKNASRFGIEVSIQSADFPDAMRYKERVLKALAGDGPEDGGLSRLGARYFPQRAVFEAPHHVRIGDQVVHGDRIILATGTTPSIPPVPGLCEGGCITNREAVDLTSLPASLLVLGAGPIGLEFAQIFRRFGSQVTVVEMAAAVLPREDSDISALAQQYLEDEGIRILTNSSAVEVAPGNAGRQRVTVQSGAVQSIHECSQILVATGRVANVKGLGLETTGMICTDHSIEVDHYLKTSVPGVLAAGDVCGGYLFTHVASYEGRLAAMNAFTDAPEPFDHRVVPRCTFIDPEVASIGMTEKEANERGYGVQTQSFSFQDLDRAVLYGDSRGMVKLVVDELNGQILGAHLIGQDASSIIAELAVCMKNHLPVSAIADTMHAYPSFPEAIEAAALSAPVASSAASG